MQGLAALFLSYIADKTVFLTIYSVLI